MGSEADLLRVGTDGTHQRHPYSDDAVMNQGRLRHAGVDMRMDRSARLYASGERQNSSWATLGQIANRSRTAGNSFNDTIST